MEDFKTINGFLHYRFIPQPTTPDESLQQSRTYLKDLSNRRSIRQFSTQEVAPEVIENIVKVAATAPSGANKQPWTFCVVSDPQIKLRIRNAAEEEEKLSYESRMSARWLKDLAPLGTDAHKPFLEEAPYLIIVFKKIYELDEEGNKHNNYYVNESVGIACGFLISAIHQSGLVTLTHTPSPMNFLSEILHRPENERAFLLLPVGYAGEGVFVPNITKKCTSEILKWY